MTGVTSVPLPAYWSSKDPEQWRRYPFKRLACSNPRCAANNANYATFFSESTAKRRGRPYKNSSRSRSVSATSNPNTPAESEKGSKSEYRARCSDCDAPLVPLAHSVSRSTTLTPPTPAQVRTIPPGSSAAGLKRSHCVPCFLPRQIREVPAHFHAGSTETETSSRAPPPSECGDYSSEELGPSFLEIVRLPAQVSRQSEREEDSKPPWSSDQASPGATVAEPGSSASYSPRSINSSHEAEDVLPYLAGLSVGITFVSGKSPRSGQHQIQEDGIVLTQFTDNDVESDSSASPVPSEKGLNLSSDVRPIRDGNRVSSFYNVLYTPDANTSDDHQADLDMRTGPADRDGRLKSALEIAVFSTFITVLILLCFPSFLSGLRKPVLGCCSCTCSTPASAAATTPSPHFGQLQWFERWAYRGASSVVGCRSSRQAVGSTVLR